MVADEFLPDQRCRADALHSTEELRPEIREQALRPNRSEHAHDFRARAEKNTVTVVAAIPQQVIEPALLEESLDFREHGIRTLSEPEPDGNAESAPSLFRSGNSCRCHTAASNRTRAP